MRLVGQVNFFYIGPMIFVKVHLHCRFLAFKMPATAAILALAPWLVWLPIRVFPLAKFIGETVSGIALRLYKSYLPCCTCLGFLVGVATNSGISIGKVYWHWQSCQLYCAAIAPPELAVASLGGTTQIRSFLFVALRPRQVRRS